MKPTESLLGQPIRSLQTMLRVLAENVDEYKTLIPDGIYGYKIYVGGRWGKKVAKGRALGKIFTTKEEALDVIEKAILLFKEQGEKGERFAETIDRIGFEKAEKQLLSDELLERKEQILAEA